jgi:hypothetical protein
MKHVMKFNEKNEIEPSITDFIEYIGSDKIDTPFRNQLVFNSF